ncbi:hypothetical protein [Glycomyces sp. YM15]|uniref:hypothetical protein n=1 Tax=Glycomyces sp. YM15 TaxID=2800446 RepID=UPI001962F5E1|nr:hypothetical protein [Glycomyces sp. YM15]
MPIEPVDATHLAESAAAHIIRSHPGREPDTLAAQIVAAVAPFLTARALTTADTSANNLDTDYRTGIEWALDDAAEAAAVAAGDLQYALDNEGAHYPCS